MPEGEEEAVAMGELTAVVQRMFDALDKTDADAAIATIGSDAQGIDEIARKWMRGSGELTTHVRQLVEMAQDVDSEMHDVHEMEWGDTGVVTFWLEQDYTLEGEREHVSTDHLRTQARVRGVEGGAVPLDPAPTGVVVEPPKPREEEGVVSCPGELASTPSETASGAAS